MVLSAACRCSLVVGGQARPGFAVEVVRVANDAGSLILDIAPQRLRIGPVTAPIDADASLRVLPRPERSWPARTVPAWKILDDETSRARLAGRIVLVGSGAPEVGGLRADAGVSDQLLGADPGRRGGDAARRRLAAAAVVGFGRRSLRCGDAVPGGDGNRAVPASGCGNAAHWCGLRGVGGRRYRRFLVATAVGRHGRAACACGRGVRRDRARRLRPERAA